MLSPNISRLKCAIDLTRYAVTRVFHSTTPRLTVDDSENGRQCLLPTVHTYKVRRRKVACTLVYLPVHSPPISCTRPPDTTMIQDGVQAILSAVQNATIASNNDTNTAAIQPPRLSDIPSLIAFILSMGGLGDWLKLFIIGGLVESARRLITSAYNALLASFVLTLHFDGDEPPYQWLMVSSSFSFRRP